MKWIVLLLVFLLGGPALADSNAIVFTSGQCRVLRQHGVNVNQICRRYLGKRQREQLTLRSERALSNPPNTRRPGDGGSNNGNSGGGGKPGGGAGGGGPGGGGPGGNGGSGGPGGGGNGGGGGPGGGAGDHDRGHGNSPGHHDRENPGRGGGNHGRR